MTRNRIFGLKNRSRIGRPLSKLTDRQRQVLSMAGSGLCNKEIAWELGVTLKTVEKHRNAINHKLNLHHPIELAHFALHYGICPNKFESDPIDFSI